MNKSINFNHVESFLIPHSNFQEAIRRLEQLYMTSATRHETVLVPLVGESGTGKTRVQKHLLKKYEGERANEGLQTPLIRISMPRKPHIGALYDVILKALGDPIPNKGTISKKAERIQCLIEGCGVRMIIIDEFQHLLKGKDKEKVSVISDTLKILGDTNSLTLVICGLPQTVELLNYPEFARRSVAPIWMRRFDWESDEDQDEFASILSAFHKELSIHFDLPKFDGDQILFRWYCATGGLITYVSRILNEAVNTAIMHKRDSITLADLHQSFTDSVSNPLQYNGKFPFEYGFTTTITKDLLALTRRIEAPGSVDIEEVATSSKLNRRNKGVPSAASVLRA
jgi:hypothetical protein